jgi:Tfp pilus assembly protein PilX
MDTGLLIAIIIIVVVVLLVLVAVLVGQRRRSRGLQERFGPEYRRTVARTGDQRAAESQLAEREQRRRQLTIVPLEPATWKHGRRPKASSSMTRPAPPAKLMRSWPG